MGAIEQYQQAVAEIKAAIGEAERLVRIVSSGATALREWKRMMMANVQDGFPPEIALSPRSPTINGSEWPTGQQLADALQRYHQAKQNLRNAYSAIPDGQRSVVQAPETFF